VIVVGFGGETYFGSNQGDNSAWFIDFPRFIRLWNSPVSVFTLLPAEEYKVMRGMMPTAPRIVVQTERYYLITNH
jgi:hypothetical protein